MDSGFWTAANIAELRRLWAKGRTGGEIATALGEGVTRDQVLGKAYRLGLPARGNPRGQPLPWARNANGG